MYDRVPVPNRQSTAKPCSILLSRWGTPLSYIPATPKVELALGFETVTLFGSTAPQTTTLRGQPVGGVRAALAENSLAQPLMCSFRSVDSVFRSISLHPSTSPHPQPRYGASTNNTAAAWAYGRQIRVFAPAAHSFFLCRYGFQWHEKTPLQALSCSQAEPCCIGRQRCH